VAESDPGNCLAGFAFLYLACIGTAVLAFLGVGFGIVALGGAARKGWAALALVLNGAALLWAGYVWLTFFGPVR
jgi:hypothetical protein